MQYLCWKIETKMTLDENICAKPFVKWVGGKTQLLGEVEKSLPGNFASINDAVCPFLDIAEVFKYISGGD